MKGAGVCSDVACRVALPTLRRAQRPPIAASIRIPCHPASPHEPVVLQRRGTPRRDKKTHVSLRGMARAWRHQWASFGRNADRDADCRGGVFAVPREDSPAHPGSPRRGSLLEYGGLKPIPPILGGRSDAACRVVIRLHASHLWGLLVFVTTWRAAL